MAIRSGLQAQCGLAAEGTWGTYTVPTRYLEMTSESMALQIERIESQAIRRANRVQRADRWVSDKKGVSGNLEFEVADRGFGLVFKHMLGAGTVVTPGGGTATREHSYTMGDMDGLSMTVQVGRPATNGTVYPFSYTGCKVTQWEISNSVGNLLSLSLSLDGQDETTAQSLGTASYPTSQSLLSYVGGTVSVAGGAMCATDISISGTNGLKTDRHCLRGSTLKKEQLVAEMSEITGTLTTEFDNLDAYNRFVNGGTASLVAAWIGSNIESIFYYTVQVTLPCVRFDGETPTVGSPDVLPQSLPFKVLNDGVSEPITILYRTSDTTP